MPASLPPVKSGAVALYPVTRANQFAVQIIQFQNGAEQRWKKSAPLNRFTLAYNGLKADDAEGLETFFEDCKGAFDSTWQFTLSSTYQYCAFEDDSLKVTETANGKHDVSFSFRQTIKDGAVTGAGSAYPVLTSGAKCQLPYARIRRFQTARNDIEAGKRYAYAYFGGGLTGFPTRALMAWELSYPALIDADADALEAFFALQNGAYGSFSFTDPDSGTAYSNVRFDMPAFERIYSQKGVNAITVKLAEFHA